MVQSQPALRLEPQVEVSLKSPGTLPPNGLGGHANRATERHGQVEVR